MGSSTSEKFDWGIDDDSIVLGSRLGIACYFNNAGNVVVRQEGGWDADADVWIAMSPEDACRVANRILNLVEEEDRGAYCRGSAQDAKDRTAVERQRRHRDKLRAATGVTVPVTPQGPSNDRDSHAVTEGLEVAAE